MVTAVHGTTAAMQGLSAYVDSIIGNDEQDDRAEATVMVQRRHWEHFQRWTGNLGIDVWEATDDVVAAYLAYLAEDDKALATIRRWPTIEGRRWALSHYFGGKHNTENPANSVRVKKVMRRITRIKGKRQKQAKPLDSEALEQIVATAHNPRKLGRGLETPGTARERAVQDIAIAYILSDCGLRVSEAAALTWGDVSEDGLIFIRRSKTDQMGEGAHVGLTEQGYAALLAYRADRSPHNQPTNRIFPMQGRRISERVKAMAKAAGLGDGYSGHSGRIGFSIRAARRGLTVSETMNAGRWKGVGMLARYQQQMTAGEFAKKLN